VERSGIRKAVASARVVAFAAILLTGMWGCRLNFTNYLALDADGSGRHKDLEVSSETHDISVKFRSLGVYMLDFWHEQLTIDFTNRSNVVCHYDWSDATLSFGDSPKLRAHDVRESGRNRTRWPIEIPPMKETTIIIEYYGDQFLEDYRTCDFLEYHPGIIRDGDDSVLWVLPPVYSFSPEKKGRRGGW